jgi:hypothetical protein
MALLPAPFGAQTRAISPAESFALVHVTVIDMTGGPKRRERERQGSRINKGLFRLHPSAFIFASQRPRR